MPIKYVRVLLKLLVLFFQHSISVTEQILERQVLLKKFGGSMNRTEDLLIMSERWKPQDHHHITSGDLFNKAH